MHPWLKTPDNIPETSAPAAAAMAALHADARVAAALEQARREDDLCAEQLVRLVETPSICHGEQERAAVFAQMLRDEGLDARIDATGNVVARVRGIGSGPAVYTCAHLDTVFEKGYDCHVTREGNIFRAPGMADDARGLACLVQVARCLKASGVRPTGDIVFVGSCGEEGGGDLYGVKGVFSGEHDCDAFVAVDGSKPGHLTSCATTSRNVAVKFTGPGGHAWGKMGQVANTNNAIGRFIAKLADYPVPDDPKISYNVGLLRGGHASNGIPYESECLLDLRSTDREVFLKLYDAAVRFAHEAAEEENRRWGVSGDNAVRVAVTVTGDRPGGLQPPTIAPVMAALAAHRSVGDEITEIVCSSTDSNIPVSLGIPSVTVTGGGRADRGHSLWEYWVQEKAWIGPQTVLLTLLALAGVDGVCEPLAQKRSEHPRWQAA